MGAGNGVHAPLTWADVITWLQGEGPALRNLLSDVFRQLPFETYSWECLPVSRTTAEFRPFEFIAMDAPSLIATKADSTFLSDHIVAYRGQAIARSFFDLANESLLVAPAQAT